MQTHEPKQGYKLVKSLFGKYEQIPSGWEISTFEEKFQFLRTGTNSRDELQESGDVNYIHYGDIHAKWNLILDCDKEKLPYIDNDKVNSLPLLKDGDVILVDASEDHEGSGASVLLRNVRDRKIVSGLHTIALRGIDENMDPNFKTYLTSIKFVKKQIIAYVTGISVYGLSKNNLKKVRIPLPPREEQQKIAAILSRVDNLIQKTDEIIEATRRLKKGLMKKLLTKGVGPHEFKEVKLKFHFLKYQIPKTWRVMQLRCLSTLKEDAIITGPFGLMLHSSDYVEEGIPLVLIKNIQNGVLIDDDIPKITPEKANELSRYRLEEGDMVFSRVGRVGSAALVKKRHQGWLISGQLLRIRFRNPQLNSLYLHYFIQSSIFNRILIPELLGSTRDSINTTILEEIPIIIPPKEEQDRISSVLSKIDLIIDNQQIFKNKLVFLKQGLMQKLLTGQIRVKV